MGRHRSQDSKDGSSRKRRRHHSSSSSTGDGDKNKRQEERVKQLERELEQMRSSSRSLSLEQSAQPRQVNLRPGDELLIPIFEPTNDEVSIEQWVTNVDEIAKQFDWDERCILRLIVSRLQGYAKQWYDLRPRIAASWTEVKTELIAQFRKPLPFAKLYQKAGSYEVRPGQNLGDYCFQKVNALRKLKLNIPDEHIIDMVIDGVKDNVLARTIRAARQTTVSGLQNYMLSLGRIPGKFERKSEVKSRFQEGGSKKGIEQQKRGDKTTETRGKQENKANNACYKCGKQGHFKRECKELNVKSANDSKSEIHEVGDRRKPVDNMYVCSVRANGHKVKALIDTGSVCTLVQPSLVNKLAVATYTMNERILRGFAGGALIVSECVKIELQVKEATASVDAVVVPDLHLEYECVVGRDFIDQEHVVMIKKHGKLIIKQVSSKQQKEDILAVNGVEVLTDDTQKIQMGELDEKAQRDCEELLQEYDDCVSSALCNLGKTDAAYMKIKCITESPIVYRPYRLSEFERGILREMIQELLVKLFANQIHLMLVQ